MIEQVYSKERLLELHKASFFGNGTLNTGLVALKQGKKVMIGYPTENDNKDVEKIIALLNENIQTTRRNKR